MNSIFTFQKSIILPAIIIRNKTENKTTWCYYNSISNRYNCYTYSNELFAKCKEILRIIHNELIKEEIVQMRIKK